MYSFAQRQDTQVVDEPFYACYLHLTGKGHPGRDEILKSQPHDVDAVFNNLDKVNAPVLFIKNMSKHLESIRTERFREYVHLLLIRDPRQIIASFIKGYPNPKMEDLGIAYQHALFDFFVTHDYRFVVLDSNEVLMDPPGVLRQLCAQLSIPFDPAMLSWPRGARSEDGVWSKYWYSSVHQSSGFLPPGAQDRQLPDDCIALYEEARPHYDALYLHALKA